jgi:hypothetical protein
VRWNTAAGDRRARDDRRAAARLSIITTVATAMGFLPPEEQAIVDRARAQGLGGPGPAPAYLCPTLCTALTLLLAVPTLGFSLVLVPILWVAQYEHTGERIQRLRWQLAMGEGPGGPGGVEPGSKD